MKNRSANWQSYSLKRISDREVNPDGTFQVKLFPDLYQISIKGRGFLSKTFRNVQLGQVPANLGMTPIMGYVYDDNRIDFFDVLFLKRSYGTVPGDLDWNAAADLDGDEEVGPSDFSILSSNYGRNGDLLP